MTIIHSWLHNLTRVEQVRQIWELLFFLRTTPSSAFDGPVWWYKYYLISPWGLTFAFEIYRVSLQRRYSMYCNIRTLDFVFSDLTNDTSCMKFEIPNSIVNDSSINRAELYVHIKRRVKNKSKNRKRHRKHNKRVTLKVRQLSNTGKIGRVLASMQRKANKSKFYPIRLPIERLKKASANDLELCVSCIGCNKRTSLTLVQKVRKNGRRRKNKHRKPKRSILSRKRPYIKFS